VSLSLDEAHRSQTWNPLIGVALLGSDFQDIGHDRHWSGFGGFNIDLRDGGFYCFALPEDGGHSSLRLVRLLFRLLNRPVSRDDGALWLQAYLAKHPGDGPAVTLVPEDDASETQLRISAARARRDMANRVPIDGTGETGGERYLRSLGILPPFPLQLYWIEAARPGEGALVVDLVASGRVVAVQRSYVDALDTRSVHQPNRQRFNLEPYRPDAVIPIAAAEAGTVNIAADRIYVEGLEKGLCVFQVKEPGWAITAVPGIATLRHQRPERQGERIIVFRDGDPKDSPADKALQAGVDELIIHGAVVRVTETPPGASAKSLLQDPEQGKRALSRLLAKPAGAALSFAGETRRLAKLEPTEYEKARKAAAAAHGVRVGHLDREVDKLRPKDEDEEASAGIISVPEDPPLTEPIPPLGEILDTVDAQLRRFMVMVEDQITAVVLWIAASHLVHSTKLQLEVFPKLAIQSKDPESGKSRLLTLVWNAVLRAKMSTNPTGAFLVRAIEQGYPSLCLDELQYAEDRNLLRVIDASQYRVQAYVPLLVPTKNGAYVPREFPVWTPMALARLGEFSSAQQSRSIIIWMLPKLPAESRERLWPIIVPELVLCRRQLAAWAATVNEWVQPSVPEGLYNRGEENWEPLLFVAEHAGGAWVERARAAAEALTAIERQPTQTRRLLGSIWKAYQPQPDKAPEPFLATTELLAKLHADPDEDWSTAGPGGRPITAAWLRERLRHLLDPEGSQRQHRTGPRGYAFRQFAGAFARYIGPTLPVDPVIDLGSSGASGATPKKPSKTVEKSAPDDEFHDPARLGTASGAAISDLSRPSPDGHSAAPDGHSAAPDDGAQVADAKPIEKPDKKLTDGLDGPDAPDVSGRIYKDNIDTAALPRQVRRRRKPPTGEAAFDLGPPAPAPPYPPGTWDAALVDEVRRLHQANPNRSLAWLAKQTGQSKSVIQAILRPAGGAE
jgi:putative DNA primase/helicase